MKHKILTLLFAIIASVGTMFAQSGTCGDNLAWNLTNGVLIISGTGEMTDYNSSSSVPWYSYRTSVQYVVIGNGVTSIGAEAFFYCTGLTSVEIPNSVTSIGAEAFFHCTGLTSVTIPNSVTSIGNQAFYYCTCLTSVTIPNSVTSIGKYAFGNCSSLTSIHVANNNPNYCSLDGVLFNKDKTTLVQYPGGKQGAYIIPNSVTSIGAEAFYYCTGLTSVTIPNSVTSIGAEAFTYCKGLKSVTIGSGVASIGKYAFGNCSSLTSITNYATTPQTISSNVFISVNISACTLYVPAGSLAAYQTADVWKEFGTIQAIGGDTPCTPISGTCGGNLTWELSCDSVLTIRGTGAIANFNSTSDNPWYAYRNAIKSVIIENGVTSIGKAAFYECSSLATIELPNSITSIGSWAFESCYSLTSMTIPVNVTSVGDYAFENCSGLTSVTMGNNVTSIGYGAFGNCSGLTSLTIGSGVTSIGNFAFYNCSSLTSVTNYATTPQTISSNVFGNVNISACTLYVPAGSLAAYRTATVWKDFGTIQAIGSDTPCTPISGTCGGNLTWKLSCDSVLTISGTGAMADFNSASDIPWYEHRDAIKSIVISKGVTSIAGNAFQKCTNLTSVTIPTSVTSIGQVAFYECTALTSVKIPGSVTSIGMGAFTYCSGLTSVTIPNDVRTIGQGAFGYCTGLRSVTIGSGITSIEQGLFGNCTALTSVTIPNNVTSIGQVAFFECTSLTSVSIPNSVTSIGQGAFGYCSSLTSVTIPSSLTTIELETFEYCSSLTSIVIPDGVTSIGEWAFQSCTSLTSVTIPSSVTSISDEVFSGCTALISVTNYATTPQTIDEYVFDNVNISACTLHVPAESVTTYKKATVWKNFGNILPIDSSVQADTITVAQALEIGAGLEVGASTDNQYTIRGYVSAIIDPFSEQYGNQTFYIADDSLSTADSNTKGGFYVYRGKPATGTAVREGALVELTTAIKKFNGNTIENSKPGVIVTVLREGPECRVLSGTCGGNLTWTLSCDSVLTVSGTGAMTDYTSSSSAPWYEHRNDVKSVLIDNNVTSIGNYAFRNCTSLTSVEIPNSVTSIGASAFYGCSSLTSVEIPNSVTSIGESAFYGCSSLVSVTIPNSVTSIGAGAFYNCSGLTSIHVANDNPNYYSVEGVLFNKYMTTLVQCPGGKQGAYIIPNSVTSIGSRAFYNCKGLTSVTIPNSVTSIGSSAFRSCTGLKSVTIGSGVANIGYGAFYKCIDLTSVTNYATTPQTIDYSVFESVGISSCTLYVPAESVEAYKAADVWKEFLEITTIGAEGIEDAQSDQVQNTKILRNGQIFIQRGEKIYTITGQEIQSY